MKVKRLIKGFIYLFPVICVLVTALASTFLRLNKNAIYLTKEVSGNTTTTYTYSMPFSTDSNNPLYSGFGFFNELISNDLDSSIWDNVSSLVGYLGVVEGEGTLYYFVISFISYELVAIMICAVLDVIFLIPEFYNKIEDKYIKGGKKRE